MPTGFQPVFDEHSEILILGSFPSVKSRETGFYYGNPQNRFWKTLETIYGESAGGNTEAKKQFLLRKKLALWDIVYVCDITGSSDGDIKNIQPADLSGILRKSKIKKIICNGKKAFEIYKKYYGTPECACICLPSTSPANVRFNVALWKKELLSAEGEV